MTPAEFKSFVSFVQAAVAGRRFGRRDEKLLQDQLEQCFKAAGLDFQREWTLPAAEAGMRVVPRDRPDFTFANGVGLECKVDGSLGAHLRQCKRYADYDEVTGIILVAMRPYPMPETLSGKPCCCLNFALKCL